MTLASASEISYGRFSDLVMPLYARHLVAGVTDNNFTWIKWSILTYKIQYITLLRLYLKFHCKYGIAIIAALV